MSIAEMVECSKEKAYFSMLRGPFATRGTDLPFITHGPCEWSLVSLHNSADAFGHGFSTAYLCEPKEGQVYNIDQQR